MLLGAGFCVRQLGLEFLPHLEEGNLWIRATMPTSISLEEGNGYVNRMRNIIRSYPEVETVVSQNGRPDDGTDATGFFNAEFFVPLKPFDTWPKGMDKEKLTKEMTERFEKEFPGVEFDFSQYIEDNVAEAASGVKGANSIKLFGNDLKTLEATAAKIKQVMETVPGVTELGILKSLGQPTVKIEIDRERAGRYGLSPGDINTTIQAAIGGQAAGNLYEDGSDRNFPIMVRLAPEYRNSLDAIRRISIGANNPSGSGVIPIPLSDVADVSLVSGASFIFREKQERYIPIKFAVRDRDLGGAVLEAQQKVKEQVRLPGGYRLEWAGEFGNLQDAVARLSVVAPLAILLIILLLYVNFSSITDALLAASVIPMALVGGIFALYFSGTAFSVSAAIGFIALFGIAAMDGIIVLSYYNQLIDAGVTRANAIVQACRTQMRPVVMTCIAACVGLLPAALATGIGSQVQKPLALVVVGGILACAAPDPHGAARPHPAVLTPQASRRRGAGRAPTRTLGGGGALRTFTADAGAEHQKLAYPCGWAGQGAGHELSVCQRLIGIECHVSSACRGNFRANRRIRVTRFPRTTSAAVRICAPWHMLATGFLASMKCRTISSTRGLSRRYSGALPPGTTSASNSNSTIVSKAPFSVNRCPGFSV